MMRVENNNSCFACGKENPFGLQVDPEIVPDGTQVKIECVPPDHFQGWANIVHGRYFEHPVGRGDNIRGHRQF